MRAFVPDDLFALTWVGNCDVSADGRRVAVVITRLNREDDCYRSVIWHVDVESGNCRQFTTGEGRDTSPRWSPDGQWLAFLREQPDDKPQLAVMPASGGEARLLTSLPLGAGQPVWSPDSSRIAFSARTGTPPVADSKKARPYRRITQLRSRLNGEGWTYDCRRHLFTLDIAAGSRADGSNVRQLTDGDWDDVQPAWSPDGVSLAFVSARHAGRDRDFWVDLWSMPANGGVPTQLTGTDAICAAPAWSPRGDRIAFLRVGRRPVKIQRCMCCHPVVVLRSLSIAGFDRQCAVASGGSPDPEPPQWIDDRRLACLAEDRGNTGLVVTSASEGTRWLLGGARSIGNVSIANASRAMAFTASSPCSPAEVFVVDADGSERQITAFNDTWLRSVSLSVPERFVAQTEPDVEVDTWIMKPSGHVEGTQYPVLLNVHGGPFTQYGERFFDEFHAYTGAGYGVVFCNPRGSSGQSSAFGRAVVGRMGDPDFHDVMTAFEQALERMPWADRSRLGVMGGSYGGFMTTWVVGHDHRFAAAVSERAVNDWYSMQGTSDIGPWFNPAYLGDRAVIEDDVEAVMRQSPLAYARHIRTPLLILHAEDDLRCPISQAEQLFVVLKRLDRDVEFVRFPDENHEMSRSGRPSHRVDRFQVILDYLARKLGAAAGRGSLETPGPPRSIHRRACGRCADS